MARRKFNILVSDSSPKLYPTDSFFGLLWLDKKKDDALELPISHPLGNEWGEYNSINLSRFGKDPMPWFLDTVWLSVTERKFYSVEEELPVKQMEELFCQTYEDSYYEDPDEEANTGKTSAKPAPLYDTLVVGKAPYGGAALWAHGHKKSTLVKWMQAKETEVEMGDFAPMNPSLTLDEVCEFYINNDKAVKKNLEKNGLPPRDLYDNYMKQFNYRYRVLFEHWDEAAETWRPYTEETKPELDFVEERLFDGTHDKLHDGGLFRFHRAGKPEKLAVEWHYKGSGYTAYFWLEDAAVRAAFDAFFGDDPGAEANFDIHIDPETMNHELVLSRDGTDEAKPFDDGDWQFIVFKDGKELGHTANYNQPRGAWVW